MSNYKPGNRFNNLEDVISEKVVWVEPWKKAHNVAFFLGWPWQLVREWVLCGYIRKTVKKESINE